jgi:hypothetical protein
VPLAVWNKELEGLPYNFFSVSLKHPLRSVAPEPLAIWNKELEGLLCNFFSINLKTSYFLYDLHPNNAGDIIMPE